MAGQPWWKDVLFRSLVLVCLASIMEKADEALLPSVYREIGLTLHASPSQLGSLTLVRSFTQASFAPVAGFLAQQYNRASIIAAGAMMWAVATFFVGISSTFSQSLSIPFFYSVCGAYLLLVRPGLVDGQFEPAEKQSVYTRFTMIWAVATFFVGISSTFSQVAISRALNGIGLAVVGPAIQSMVADATVESKRGMAFGWLGVAGNLGSILGGLVALLLAETTILGVAGWRMAFHVVAFLSVIVGVLVYFYAVDPQFSTSPAAVLSRQERTFMDNVREIYLDTKNVIQIRSFQLFVAQGVAGSFPWAALAFASLWLELTGFSHDVTAILMGCFVVATSLGGLFGGWMGDYLSMRLPNTGRIILSQISAGSGIPLGAILLLALPTNPSTPVLHGAVLFIMGITISWNGAATNGPIFAEIVPEKSRTNIYALDRAFEAVLASFAPPIVGLLAEHVYGYIPPPKTGVYKEDSFVDRENAVALSKALYTSVGIPFFLCASIYTGLYWTYPRDRDRVREMQMDFQEEAHIPLDEITAKEEHIWTVGEDEDDEGEDEYMEVDKQQEKHGAALTINDGAGESETAQMLPKHEMSL